MTDIKKEKMERIGQALNERMDRIQRAGYSIERHATVPEAQRKLADDCRKPQSWKKTRVSWKSITYVQADFRNTCIQFENDKNLSRFVWRTAKINGMNEVTLSDVQRMLDAADETIWILSGKHEFLAEDPNRRAPTWVMDINRKRMYAALMTITDKGWATTELRDITIQGEQRQQRVWTLGKDKKQ